MYSANYKILLLLYIFNILLKTSAVFINMNDIGIDNSKITGTVIKTISNIGFLMCARKCEAISSCQAINYHKSFLLCDLLSKPLKGQVSSGGWLAVNNMTWIKTYKLSTGLEQENCPMFNRKVKLKSGNVHCSGRNYPDDCQNERINSSSVSQNVYRISPKENSVFDVLCDFKQDGGAWTVIQARVDANVDFNRLWNNYKVGFGNLHGSFWLGNDNIHSLVSVDNYTLRVDMEYFDGIKRYAEYSTFYVAGEDDKYRLTVGGYTGNAGDSLQVHNDKSFSTKDSNNDTSVDNCANIHKGGWWFLNCYGAFLNGIYYNKSTLSGQERDTGIHWFGVKNGLYSMKRVSMKIRKKPKYVTPSVDYIL